MIYLKAQCRNPTDLGRAGDIEDGRGVVRLLGNAPPAVVLVS